MAIRLIVDSAADIPRARAEALGLRVLPLLVTFGSEHYRDGEDITAREFFEKLVESDGLPTTSQVSPYSFEQAYRQTLAAGDTPVAITISSRLSGTYQSACIALEGLEGRAFAVDSLSVSVGEGILVEYAARLIDRGLSAPALVAELERVRSDIRIMALLDTLEYLKKGGRISAATAFAGGLLSLKPVISIVDGAVELVGKARGSRCGNNLLMELVAQSGGIDYDRPLSLAYSGLDDTLLQKYIADSQPLWAGRVEALPVAAVGATIGTYAGPGAVVVAFFRRKD